MIIIISNRNIKNDSPDDQGNFDENYFGNELATDGVTGMAIAEPNLVEDLDEFDEDGELNLASSAPRYEWRLKSISKSKKTAQYKKMLKGISADTVNKNWMFFVHGNNQTTLKNLEKCRQIEELHDVNVITFSWPSWRGKIFTLDLLKEVAPDILKKGGISKGIVASIIASGITLKQQHYNEAVINAIASRAALHETLIQVNQHFIEPARSTFGKEFTINLLVHSLGNRVLQYMINDESLGKLSKFFDNVILHQADVDTKGHDQWVKNIKLGKRLYITHNRKDAILHISDIFGSNPKRLGHKSGNAKCSAKEVTAYIDFTKGFKVGLTHGLFLMRDIFSGKVNDCFNDLLTGESLFVAGNLPAGFKKENKNTFTMKKEIYIAEEEDYWGYN